MSTLGIIWLALAIIVFGGMSLLIWKWNSKENLADAKPSAQRSH